MEFLFNKVAALKVRNFVKKETPTQLVSCEYCEIFKSTFFYRTPLVAVSAMYRLLFCAILAQADQNKIV